MVLIFFSACNESVNPVLYLCRWASYSVGLENVDVIISQPPVFIVSQVVLALQIFLRACLWYCCYFKEQIL